MALEEIKAHHITCDDGIWHLNNICEVAGLGAYRDRERDGTPYYYTTENVVSNDVKGVGPLMMAEAERIRLAARSGISSTA